MDTTILFIVFAVVFVSLSFWVQNKQRKQAQNRYKQLQRLSRGDQIVTIGGLYATVDGVDAEKGTIVLDVNGIFLTYELIAIKRVVKAHLADGKVEIANDAEL